MAQVRCIFGAHYKRHNGNQCDWGECEVWLPENEAWAVNNDAAARERIFRSHFPTAEYVSAVSMRLMETRR